MSILAHRHSLEILLCPYPRNAEVKFYGKTGCLALRYPSLLCTCSPCDNRNALLNGKLHARIFPAVCELSESTIMSLLTIHLNHRLSPHLCAHGVCSQEYQSSVGEP